MTLKGRIMPGRKIPTAQAAHRRRKDSETISDSKGRKQYKNPQNPGGFESADDAKTLNNLRSRHGDQN